MLKIIVQFVSLIFSSRAHFRLFTPFEVNEVAGWIFGTSCIVL